LADAFVRDAQKAIAVLEAINEKHDSYDEEDLRTYTIQVHGMKSALANIGKAELATVARRLEMAAREGNTRILSSETTEFLRSLRKLIEELSPKDATESDGTAKENLLYLREKLIEIQAACEKYDEKTVDDIITELKEKTWSDTTKKLLDTIAEHLLHSDFNEIVEMANTFIDANNK